MKVMDMTNAFGSFISSLAGLNDIIDVKKWPSAGIVRGPKRNIAWRVLDSKFFGVPQQRKRLYVLAGGKSFFPENIIFENCRNIEYNYPKCELVFEKDGHKFEVFREYTDCLYSAYGTKWNGNAAAYNGSLFVVQDNRIRRLSPLECERLMGFPDNYTNISGAKRTQRYKAIGNSWAVPVINWIGRRIIDYKYDNLNLSNYQSIKKYKHNFPNCTYWNFDKNIIKIDNNISLNCTYMPEKPVFTNISEIISPDNTEQIYISPVGCNGIIRRSEERGIAINSRLKEILLKTVSKLSSEEIEKRSRVQKRGRLNAIEKSTNIEISTIKTKHQDKASIDNISSNEVYTQLTMF